MEAATSTEEKFQLYKRYQMKVHGDKESKLKDSSFRRFLCDSPLRMEKSPLPSQPYGSFHQMYRIDGHLVAFGVLDILPGAVSGVYFIYDPDWSALSLGKVSALRECALAFELEQMGMGRMFYMMGYYIHNCQKMKYKAEYSPSYLLDPEMYEWLPFTEVCKPILDKNSHAIFSQHQDDSMAVDESGAAQSDDSRHEVAATKSASSSSTQAGDDGRDSDDDDGEEEEEEDAEETLSDPPPPGFLDPGGLPRPLLSSIYAFEKGQVTPLLLSHAWRSGQDTQRKLREGVAAMGKAAVDTCLFV